MNQTYLNTGSSSGDLFQRVDAIGSFDSDAQAFATALTLLEDELLITAIRYWPMWSVIISVILHIDVVFIMPTMLSVLACYVVATALYLRNPFGETSCVHRYGASSRNAHPFALAWPQ